MNGHVDESRKEHVMRHTHYTPLATECAHGERTDRRTSEDRPICALCRHEEDNRWTPCPDTIPDWGALAANDRDENDRPRLETPTAPLPVTTARIGHVFTADPGNVENLISQWRTPEREGILF